MKYLSILLISCLFGCKGSLKQLSEIKRPAVVFAVHKSKYVVDGQTMIIKDADGKLISLSNDVDLNGLIDKYNVGDSLK